MIRVRRLTPFDVDKLIQLLKNAGIPLDKALGLLADFMVCETDEGPIGCGCLHSEKEKGYLNWVFVAEAYRRDKLGSTIVKALLNAADRGGVTEAYAPAGCCDAFLKSLRFEPLEPLPSVLADRYAEIFGNRPGGIYRAALPDYFKACCPSE